MRLRPAALALILLAGCARVQTREILPWFRVRTTTPYESGIVSLGSKNVQYVVNVGGRWKTLPIYGGAAFPINDDTIFFYLNGNAQIIRRGQTTWRAACDPAHAFATIAREAEAIDCIEPLAGPAGVPTSIRWRRMSAGGKVVAERTLNVEAPDRVFMPVVKFYDDNGSPYFVTLHTWPYNHPACAIMDANGHSVAGPRMRVANCSSAGIWSDVLQRRLH
jgi:hypothetical protein